MNSAIQKTRTLKKARRKARVRKKIYGTASKPRVTVYRSNKNFTAQAIDDVNGVTIAAVNGAKEGNKNTVAGVQESAKAFADALKAKDVTEAVYDRSGYLYHGVIKAFADALRDNGIKL
ncbi:MAG: 50S ribosomal protein L18 [Campylobacterota bacterium]